jgi:phosphoribosylglycinamide formyltransferase-1
MYGKHVHATVLESGETKSGISIHHVSEEYDKGKIIFQAETPIEKGETIESLEKKIHRLEHQHYPVIIEKLMKS